MCSMAPPPSGGCATISRSRPWMGFRRCRGWKRPLPRTLSGGRRGSLLDAIDCTVTPAGSRLLAQRLAAPLTDAADITRRLDAISAFVTDSATREDIRSILRGAPDMSRALARLSVGRGGPRDLAGLRDGIIAADQA